MSKENVEILGRAVPESAPANPEDLFSIFDENVECRGLRRTSRQGRTLEVGTEQREEIEVTW